MSKVINFEEARKRLRPVAEDFKALDPCASYGCIEGTIKNPTPTDWNNEDFSKLDINGIKHINDLVDMVYNNLINKNEDKDHE